MGNKKAYQQRLYAQLDEWNAEIEILKARAYIAETGVRFKYYEAIEDLRIKQEFARQKIAELNGASQDTWEDLKADVEAAWNTLSQAVRRATARFD